MYTQALLPLSINAQQINPNQGNQSTQPITDVILNNNSPVFVLITSGNITDYIAPFSPYKITYNPPTASPNMITVEAMSATTGNLATTVYQKGDIVPNVSLGTGSPITVNALTNSTSLLSITTLNLLAQQTATVSLSIEPGVNSIGIQFEVGNVLGVQLDINSPADFIPSPINLPDGGKLFYLLDVISGESNDISITASQNITLSSIEFFAYPESAHSGALKTVSLANRSGQNYGSSNPLPVASYSGWQTLNLTVAANTEVSALPAPAAPSYYNLHRFCSFDIAQSASGAACTLYDGGSTFYSVITPSHPTDNLDGQYTLQALSIFNGTSISLRVTLTYFEAQAL